VQLTSITGRNVSQIAFSYGLGAHWLIDLDSIQIEEGVEATEYEPYIPAPTPDYPQEIKCVGDKTKNLFDVFNQTYTSASDRCVTEALEDGTLRMTNLKVSQYSTAGCWLPYKVSDFVGKTITVSFKTKCSNEDLYSGISVRFETIDGTSGWNALEKFNYGSSTITLSKAITETMAQTYGRIRFNFYTNASSAAIGEVGDYVDFENIQLEISDVATEFEPYGKYKIPITVRGKNLSDINNPISVISGATYNVTDNIATVRRGTAIYAPSIYWELGDYADFVGKTLTLSIKLTEDNGSGNVKNLVYFTGSVGTNRAKYHLASVSPTLGKTIKLTCTVGENTEAEKLCIRLYLQNLTNAEDTASFTDLQVEEGTVATPYEPCVEPVTHNIFLDEPLRKVGDYADYIDFKNQKVIRKVSDYTISVKDSDTLRTYNLPSKDGSDIGQYQSYNVIISSKIYQAYQGVLSEVATANTDKDYYKVERYTEGYMRENPANIMFYFDMSETIETAKEKINGTKLIYVLAEPIEQPIELPTFETNKYTNIIEVGTTLQPSNVIAQYYKKG
jgi:hypothetical protein